MRIEGLNAEDGTPMPEGRRMLIQGIYNLMTLLTPYERALAMRFFCPHCCREQDPKDWPCQCWNDE